MPLRRARTVPNTAFRHGPGSAAHRKSAALRPGNESVPRIRDFRTVLSAPGQYGSHVVAPAGIATPPDLDAYTKWDGFDLNRLGARVPMVMVSPYIRKNTIINEPMSHTSFLRTVHEKWQLASLSTREDASPYFHRTSPCPGRDAARSSCEALHRRTGTIPSAAVCTTLLASASQAP